MPIFDPNLDVVSAEVKSALETNRSMVGTDAGHEPVLSQEERARHNRERLPELVRDARTVSRLIVDRASTEWKDVYVVRESLVKGKMGLGRKRIQKEPVLSGWVLSMVNVDSLRQAAVLTQEGVIKLVEWYGDRRGDEGAGYNSPTSRDAIFGDVVRNRMFDNTREIAGTVSNLPVNPMPVHELTPVEHLTHFDVDVAIRGLGELVTALEIQ